MSKASKVVVAAGLIVRHDRLLITKRMAGGAMPFFWEFPGGKVEARETPEKALAREIQEELGVSVQVGRIHEVLHTMTPTKDIYLLFYACSIGPEEAPQCRQVSSWTWARADELTLFRFLPADRELIKRLATQGVNDLKIA